MATKYQHWKALKGDTYRQLGCFSFLGLVKRSILSRTFRVVVTMRLCQMVAGSRTPVRLLLPLFKVMHKISTGLAGVDCHWKTDVGAGFAITHGWGMVINEGAKIGKNVTIMQGVTLGRRDKISPDNERTSTYPTIEDEVWIGPNSVIVGGVSIGKGSRIAGGSLVLDDVPPYSTVMGNPARIVRENCIPDVFNPAP
ncbi:Serine acetyltransferase [Vibrio aerogenes CECT 7868]|uniref:Serine acetyltransferase n=1 Tax=Vibrio aerogenes CECT 7868 TaxID=1216006 RepID=A0A1M6ECS0_9VIBR|nr:serine acetyltransferase [Vibrio aerogenes]SHI83223.1 Serine acetyltransferase [Vibrio aerogenes CECT 7868]